MDHEKFRKFWKALKESRSKKEFCVYDHWFMVNTTDRDLEEAWNIRSSEAGRSLIRIYHEVDTSYFIFVLMLLTETFPRQHGADLINANEASQQSANILLAENRMQDPDWLSPSASTGIQALPPGPSTTSQPEAAPAPSRSSQIDVTNFIKSNNQDPTDLSTTNRPERAITSPRSVRTDIVSSTEAKVIQDMPHCSTIVQSEGAPTLTKTTQINNVNSTKANTQNPRHLSATIRPEVAPDLPRPTQTDVVRSIEASIQDPTHLSMIIQPYASPERPRSTQTDAVSYTKPNIHGSTHIPAIIQLEATSYLPTSAQTDGMRSTGANIQDPPRSSTIVQPERAPTLARSTQANVVSSTKATIRDSSRAGDSSKRVQAVSHVGSCSTMTSESTLTPGVSTLPNTSEQHPKNLIPSSRTTLSSSQVPPANSKPLSWTQWAIEKGKKVVSSLTR